MDKKEYVSLKSINLMSDREGVVPKSLAIVPFPSYNLKGFIKSIVTKDQTRRGGIIDSSITVLFDESNALVFYKYIDTLENLFSETAIKLNNLIESKAEKPRLEQELLDFYNNIMDNVIKIFMKKPETEQEEKTSLLLLFGLIQKNLDKVLYALILGDPVIVTGDKTLVKLIIDTICNFFYIEQTHDLKIIFWTNEYTSGNIIGGPLSLKEIYKTNLCIDLKKGRVIGGKRNKYCKKLISQARQLDSEHAEEKIKEKLKAFYSIANEIIDISSESIINTNKIDKLIKKLDLDELELIETFTTLKNPDISKEIMNVISLCRKKMDKILSGFEKERW